MRRIPRSVSLLFFAAILLVSSNIQPSSASGAPAQDEKELTVSVLVELSRGVPLGDALKIAESSQEPVVGYRYENLGVVGEFYLSESRSAEEFGDRFLKRYGTQLRIVGLLVSRVYDLEREAPVDGPARLDVAGEDFVPAAADTSALKAGRDALVQEIEDVKTADGGGAGGSAHTANGLMLDDPPSTDWFPDATSVDIQRDDDVVLFQEYVYWDDHEPTDVPAGYGLEVEVNLYNDDLPDTWRPLCASSDYEQYFANNHDLTWSIATEDPYATDDLDAYFDSDIDDGCNKQGFAIGMRFPQEIPESLDGSHIIQIEIEAAAGEVDESRIEGNLQLVDDSACTGPFPFLPFCMGFNELSPSGVEQSTLTLSSDRRWFAPDRCWLTYDFVSSVEPLESCGQPDELSGLNATDLDLDESYGPMTVEIQYSACTWIDSTSPGSPIEPYATYFPYAYDPDREVGTDSIGDVRAWIGDEEIPISHEGWNWIAPTSGAYYRLDSDNGAIVIGDGSVTQRDAFAADGTISFRVDDVGPNYFRIQNMNSFLPYSGVDTSEALVAKGSTSWWDSELVVLRGGYMHEECSDIVPSYSNPDDSGTTFEGDYYFPSTDLDTYEDGLAVYSELTGVDTLTDEPIDVSGLLVYDDVLYFMGSTPTWNPGTFSFDYYNAIYSYSGISDPIEVPDTTSIVPSLHWGGYTSAEPRQQTVLVELDNLIYFFGSDSTNGYQLWSFDPSDGDVEMVGPALPAFDYLDYGAQPYGLTSADDALYFVAPSGEGPGGEVLSPTVWTYDGTGIPELTDLPVNTGSSPHSLVTLNDELYVVSDLDQIYTSPPKLWAIDGTDATLVDEMSDPDLWLTAASRVVEYDGSLYFLGFYSTDGLTRLFEFDGTDTVVADDPLGSGVYGQVLGSFSGGVVMWLADGDGAEPWLYDGFSLYQLKDIASGSSGSYPAWIGATNQFAYLSASGALWVVENGGVTTRKSPVLQYPTGSGIYAG